MFLDADWRTEKTPPAATGWKARCGNQQRVNGSTAGKRQSQDWNEQGGRTHNSEGFYSGEPCGRESDHKPLCPILFVREKNIVSFRAMMVCLFKGANADDADGLVYSVLRHWHVKEAVRLEEQLERKRQAAISEARTDIAEKRAQEREKLQAAFEQELLELVENPMGLSLQELSAEKESLKDRQKVKESPEDRLNSHRPTKCQSGWLCVCTL